MYLVIWLRFASGSAQPRFYDRDGRLLGECIRGDMYIRDMKNTKGHITSCTGGCWHPTDRLTAITCSEDGTVRVWDAHNIMQKTVVRPTTPSAARVAVTACGYNSSGKLLAAGMMDGTIQVCWQLTNTPRQDVTRTLFRAPAPCLASMASCLTAGPLFCSVWSSSACKFVVKCALCIASIACKSACLCHDLQSCMYFANTFYNCQLLLSDNSLPATRMSALPNTHNGALWWLQISGVACCLCKSFHPGVGCGW